MNIPPKYGRCNNRLSRQLTSALTSVIHPEKHRQASSPRQRVGRACFTLLVSTLECLFATALLVYLFKRASTTQRLCQVALSFRPFFTQQVLRPLTTQAWYYAPASSSRFPALRDRGGARSGIRSAGSRGVDELAYQRDHRPQGLKDSLSDIFPGSKEYQQFPLW